MANRLMDDASFDDALDDAAQRLMSGMSLDAALRADPLHADALREPVSAVSPLRALQLPVPSSQARASARRAMFAQLDAPAHRRLWIVRVFAGFDAPRLRFQALAGGLAVVLFGGIGLASAAGDHSPVRVPSFLHVLSTSSESSFEARGEIAAVSPDHLTLHTKDGDRTFLLDATTEVRMGTSTGTVANLAIGQIAVIRATRTDGGDSRATRVFVTPPAPPPGGAPAAGSTSSSNGGGVAPATPTPGRKTEDGHGAAPGGTTTPAKLEDGHHNVTTPEPNDHGDDEGTPAGGATVSPGATSESGEDGHDEDQRPTATPATNQGPSATNTPRSGLTPEPTEKPEATAPAEPTEQPEPTEAH